MRRALVGAGLTLQVLLGCAQSAPTLPTQDPPAAEPQAGIAPAEPTPEGSLPVVARTENENVTGTVLESPASPPAGPTAPAAPPAPTSPIPSPTPPPEPTLEGPAIVENPATEDSTPSEPPTISPPEDAYIALAQFTTQIEDREPVDAISFLDDRSSEIIFFTDLRGFGGHTLAHRWEYRGEVMGEVPIPVEKDRWRAWSSKQLLPAWTGDWTVSVVNSDGEVIATETFNYSKRP